MTGWPVRVHLGLRCHPRLLPGACPRPGISTEIGSVLGAYAAALTTARLTRRFVVIAAALIPGTLLGGTIFWLAARIAHQRQRRNWSVRGLAHDIGYFTPAAATLGFVVYDPAIFFASHFLLVRGAGVVLSVAGGEITKAARNWLALPSRL